MIVYENPYARVPLGRDLFCGPFDQRFGLKGEFILRVFVGDEMAAIEAELGRTEMLVSMGMCCLILPTGIRIGGVWDGRCDAACHQSGLGGCWSPAGRLAICGRFWPNKESVNFDRCEAHRLHNDGLTVAQGMIAADVAHLSRSYRTT